MARFFAGLLHLDSQASLVPSPGVVLVAEENLQAIQGDTLLNQGDNRDNLAIQETQVETYMT
ncbi:hypothetical protein T458_03935 [Brevibacillus panacihumi W25]|uniref:Uncharacterized protein n=1 Tax=Brevibacillus panacihumi W25 TaxID=1408254 RepID=V6MET5_9BACL|nr:hypothetical protein T458_03935 [Brevibacillus panacihumi W25]